MAFRKAGLGLVIAGLVLAGCEKKEPDAETNAAIAAKTAAPRTQFIGLPNGATISVEPGSIGQKMATYLASSEPAPRSFEIGGEQFADWSATAKPEIRAMVPGLVELLKSYPDVKLRIEGHSDNVGGVDKNMKISQSRADMAKRYLTDAGVSDARIEAVGKGMAEPIADNDTVEGRARNRRIELVIVEK